VPEQAAALNVPAAQALLEAMSEAVYAVDCDRRVTYWNAAAEQLTGYRASDVVGSRCRDNILNHCDDQGTELCAAGCPLLATMEDGRAREARVFLHHRDGHLVPVVVRAAALRSGDGAVIGAVEVFRDDSRSRADLQFRAFVEQAPVAIVVTRQGAFLYANHKLAEMMGLKSADELVGTETSQVFAPHAREASKDRTRRLSLGLPAPAEFESVVQRPDGSQFPVHCAKGTVLLPDGDAYITFVTDITDRQRAEEALRAGKAMRDLTEPVARIGSWRRPLRAGQSLWTDGMFALFDTSRAEFEADSQAVLARSVHPDDLGLLREALAALDQTGEPVSRDIRVVRRDGTQRVVHAEGRVEREETGEEVVIGYCQDVTDQREAGGRLATAAQEWRETFDAMEDSVLLVAGDGHIVRCNAATAALTGRDYADIVGRHCYEVLHGPGHTGECAACPQRLAFETGKACTSVLEREGRWLRASCKPRLDADGNINGGVHVVTDITQLRQAERAASERSHFLEELLEAVPVPVFYNDVNLRYAGVNQAYAAWVGRPKDQIIGKTVFEIGLSEAAEAFDTSDRDLLARPRQLVEQESVVTGQGGKLRNALKYKAVYSDVGGKPAGIVGVLLDVTEIRQAEKELASAAGRLERTLNGAVSALSATTELRDPYTAGHQRRVAELASAVACLMGMSEPRRELLLMAALVHDIGKIVVPAEILSKPGKLSEIEMQIVRQHPGAGADIIEPIGFDPDVAEMVRQHHERLDGSGYPAGLRGDEILVEARVLAVADVFEAMISHRPYRPGLPIAKAVAELEDGAGVRYEAAACEAAISLICHQRFTFSQ
jgi:PAS domain S-box-containing protein/putative nucleotidyltransferase with HDIG domain